MGLPEPTAALGLWPKVRAYSGWPATNEDTMDELAAGWLAARDHFSRPAEFSTAPGQAAWDDGPGTTFTGATVQKIEQATDSLGDTALLAQAATGFGQEVRTLKQSLNDLIELNLPAYAAIQGLPAGIRGLFEPLFVAQVASFATSMVQATAGRATTLGAVPVSAVNQTPAPGVQADPLAGFPPPGASPADVAAWWSKVPEDQRSQLIQQHPDLLGNRDGIPAAVRDQANRILLGRQREALLAERALLQTQLLDNHSPGGQALNPAIQRQIDQVDGKLRGIDAINARLNSTPTVSKDVDGFFLLGLDPAGEGRFIVARGNPDTAKNVATFVPGSLTDLSQADTLLNQGDALHRAAVHAGSPQAADQPSTSVITWLDYDSPDSIPAAAFPGKAEDGAVRLNGFQEGLRATHIPGPPSHNTVVGHSYGSTVAGFAASQGRPLPADEIIAAGSPGLGVGHANELSVGERHVWVVESPHDPIADTGVFTADPSQDGFGARVYNSEPGPPVGSEIPSTSGYAPYSPGNKLPQYDYTAASHDSYFREEPGGNAGLDTMGQIIAGNDPPPR